MQSGSDEFSIRLAEPVPFTIGMNFIIVCSLPNFNHLLFISDDFKKTLINLKKFL